MAVWVVPLPLIYWAREIHRLGKGDLRRAPVTIFRRGKSAMTIDSRVEDEAEHTVAE